MKTVTLSNLHFRDNGTSRSSVYGTLYCTLHGSKRTKTEIIGEGTLDYCISLAEVEQHTIKMPKRFCRGCIETLTSKNRGKHDC
jgi:hypothetical protein